MRNNCKNNCVIAKIQARSGEISHTAPRNRDFPQNFRNTARLMFSKRNTHVTPVNEIKNSISTKKGLTRESCMSLSSGVEMKNLKRLFQRKTFHERTSLKLGVKFERPPRKSTKLRDESQSKCFCYHQ